MERFDFCSSCPQKKEKIKFREEAENLIAQRLNTNTKYRFNDLLALLHDVMSFEDLNKEKLSVKANYFLNVYLQERNRKERIEQKKAG